MSFIHHPKKEEPRPYVLLDTYTQNVMRTFTDQNKALSCLVSFLRTEPKAVLRDLNLLYVDEDEVEHLLCYGTQPELQAWYEGLDQLVLQLRLSGTDLDGLDEFIQFNNLTFTEWESDTPLTTLDFERYHARIGPAEVLYPGGATKLEAIARAYIGYKRTLKHGRTT